MTKYIEKDALVAEITRRKDVHFTDYHINKNGRPADYGACNALCQLLSFIDTLEVKEVDLESEQRMRECPYRQVVCTMYEGKILECKGACSWVVDYPKLKELKTRKGE